MLVCFVDQGEHLDPRLLLQLTKPRKVNPAVVLIGINQTSKMAAQSRDINV